MSEENDITLEALNLIIDAYEKEALNSKKESGIFASMMSPLDGFDMILSSSENNLKQMKSSRQRKASAPQEQGVTTKEYSDGTNSSPNPSKGSEKNFASLEYTQADFSTPIPTPPKAELTFQPISKDIDMLDLFGINGEKTPMLHSLFAECLACDGRIQFNWQIPPVDLLAPVTQLLSAIAAALDKLEKLTDPTALMKQFCSLMNNFKFICIPDWIAILIALKMLLQKYLTLALKVKLDWTVILGPLLELVSGALASLMEALAGILTGPLSCVQSSLQAFEDLMDSKNELKSALEQTKNALKDSVEGFGAGITTGLSVEMQFRDYTFNKDTNLFSSIERDKDEPVAENAWASVFSGFEIEANRDLSTEVQKEDFNLLGALIASIAEARKYVEELIEKITNTFKSIQGLVSGGLSIQLEALGMIGLILFIIRLVMMIINLLKSGVDPLDWCSFLSENPDKLEDALKRSVDPRSYAKNGVINIGGYPIEMKSCITQRTTIDKNILNQWISELGVK